MNKATCEACGIEITDEDIIYDQDGDPLCPVCFDYNSFVCEGCCSVFCIDNVVALETNGQLCRECAKGKME